MRISENLPSTRLDEQGERKGRGYCTPAPGLLRLEGKPERASRGFTGASVPFFLAHLFVSQPFTRSLEST